MFKCEIFRTTKISEGEGILLSYPIILLAAYQLATPCTDALSYFRKMLWNPFSGYCFNTNAESKNENRVTLSSLSEIVVNNYQAPTYGIKYVMHGTETYSIQGKNYKISTGNFLLVNSNEALDFEIKSKSKVTGLCIHLEAELMANLHNQLISSEEQLLDNPAGKEIYPELEPLLYSNKENRLGTSLEKLSMIFTNSLSEAMPEEHGIYYNLGTQMLLLQTPRTQLAAMRNSTKTELVRRLMIARAYISENAMHGLDINLVAKESMMSAPHLYRTFKKLYGVSPYVYATSIRLQKAKQLLSDGYMASEIYADCGYADLPSFSKAFKKMFELSPINFQLAM